MNCKELNNCNKQTLQAGEKFVGTDFDICLPFGGRLYSVAGVVQYAAPASVPADGTYTSFDVRSGCISSAGQAPISITNNPPCAPVPVPCDCAGSSGGTTAASLSTDATNLSYLDSSGKLMTSVALSAGTGVSIQGMGTTANPYVISVSGSGNVVTGDTVLMSANDAIALTGTGSSTDPYVLTHATTLGITSQVNGMTFDRYGHLVSSTNYSNTSVVVRGVMSGYGIATSTDVNTGIVTIELEKPAHPFKDRTINVGDYTLEIDEYNRIYRIIEATPAGASGTSSGTGTSFCHRFGANQQVEQTVTFSISKSGGLRIELDSYGTIDSPTLKVDNEGLTLYPIVAGHRYMTLTGTKSAGQHSVVIGGDIPNITFLTITVCERV